MSLIHLVVIALVQGITEFLPISSSAHLILTPAVIGAADQGPLIDVMAHAGSLLAVLVYFRSDIWSITKGKFALLQGRVTPGGRIVLLVVATMPPVILAGGALYAFDLVDALRSPAVIAASTLIFALPLWLADRYGRTSVTTETLGYKAAALIGLAQAFALIPGASRSGVTMTAARALGMKRSEAARFSMLMAIPVIAGFGLVSGVELARSDAGAASLTDGLVVAGLSFIAAWAAIAVLMKLVDRIGFLPFVLYRLGLGAVLIWFLLA